MAFQSVIKMKKKITALYYDLETIDLETIVSMYNYLKPTFDEQKEIFIMLPVKCRLKEIPLKDLKQYKSIIEEIIKELEEEENESN